MTGNPSQPKNHLYLPLPSFSLWQEGNHSRESVWNQCGCGFWDHWSTRVHACSTEKKTKKRLVDMSMLCQFKVTLVPSCQSFLQLIFGGRRGWWWRWQSMAKSCLLRKSEPKGKKSTQNVSYLLAGRVSMIYCYVKNISCKHVIWFYSRTMKNQKAHGWANIYVWFDECSGWAVIGTQYDYWVSGTV